MTTRGVVGVCGVRADDARRALSPQDERTLTAILDQTAIAIDRSLLVERIRSRAAALEENEKLRTTLLASLSHDLRTPLASITGAVTSLRQLRRQNAGGGPARTCSPRSRRRRGGSARFVANLLDMSRIEAGALEAAARFRRCRRGRARRGRARAQGAFPGTKIATSLAPDLPPIRGDANLLEQVLFNLLDNAQKYGGGSAARPCAAARRRRTSSSPSPTKARA